MNNSGDLYRWIVLGVVVVFALVVVYVVHSMLHKILAHHSGMLATLVALDTIACLILFGPFVLGDVMKLVGFVLNRGQGGEFGLTVHDIAIVMGTFLTSVLIVALAKRLLALQTPFTPPTPPGSPPSRH